MAGAANDDPAPLRPAPEWETVPGCFPVVGWVVVVVVRDDPGGAGVPGVSCTAFEVGPGSAPAGTDKLTIAAARTTVAATALRATALRPPERSDLIVGCSALCMHTL